MKTLHNFHFCNSLLQELEGNSLDKVNITIETPKGNFSLQSRSGLGFQAVIVKNKVPTDFDCLKADCGICIMKVIDGGENLSATTKAESDFLKAMRADKDERLACQCRVFGNVHVKFEY